MDNLRIILFFALSFVLLLIWQAWQQDYGTPETPSAPASVPGQQAPAPQPPADVPAAPGAPAAPPAPGAAAVAPAPEAALARGERVHVVTDLIEADIDTVGGDLRAVALLDYPVSADQPHTPYRLMEDQPPRIFIAQSGLLSKQPAPDHHARYQAEGTEYRLAPGTDRLVVPLHWRGPNGVTVTKRYVFHRNRYEIDVEHQIDNGSQQPWTGNEYRQFQRTAPGKDETSRFARTYIGGVIYSKENKYDKIDFSDMQDEDLSRDLTAGWAAMIQHYFIGAWIPPLGQLNHYYTKAPADHPFVLGMISPPKSVEPGQSGTFTTRLYVGPKEQDRMARVEESLKLTVDYGMLTVIAEPLFWLLRNIHKLVHNWGWSIVLLTLIVKLVFFKLSETSYRSMANMRKLQPKITQLRERYGDDRQRMSQAMMELYKKEKVNPLGGCLPMIVQIPVFIALYWVLLESVELRQAPFALWINDLSDKDPYYVLPLLMGVTMFFQQKLNPPPPDPVQAKVMMALPFIFTAFFAFFPSGLVLYWVTNSVLSIAQQWYITYRVEQAANAARNK